VHQIWMRACTPAKGAAHPLCQAVGVMNGAAHCASALWCYLALLHMGTVLSKVKESKTLSLMLRAMQAEWPCCCGQLAEQIKSRTANMSSFVRWQIWFGQSQLFWQACACSSPLGPECSAAMSSTHLRSQLFVCSLCFSLQLLHTVS